MEPREPRRTAPCFPLAAVVRLLPVGVLEAERGRHSSGPSPSIHSPPAYFTQRRGVLMDARWCVGDNLAYSAWRSGLLVVIGGLRACFLPGGVVYSIQTTTPASALTLNGHLSQRRWVNNTGPRDYDSTSATSPLAPSSQCLPIPR